MSRILVLGATGYVGREIATAFGRRGYNVYGLARSEDKAKLLAQEEIKPVLGQAQEVSSWLSVAEESDVVVESIADYQNPATAKVVSEALIALLKRKPNILVIYTSGIWVHGDSRGIPSEFVDERIVKPFGIVAWRPALENAYLSAGAVVLRPGLVYGKSGSITGMWFSQVLAGSISFPQTTLVSTVHVDDLAESYVLTVENAPKVRGQTFNLISQIEHPASAFAATKHLTNPALQIGVPAVPAQAGTMAEPLEATQVLDGTKARLVLGWAPTHKSFTLGLPRYFDAWKAHQK